MAVGGWVGVEAVYEEYSLAELCGRSHRGATGVRREELLAEK